MTNNKKIFYLIIKIIIILGLICLVTYVYKSKQQDVKIETSISNFSTQTMYDSFSKNYKLKEDAYIQKLSMKISNNEIQDLNTMILDERYKYEGKLKNDTIKFDRTGKGNTYTKLYNKQISLLDIYIPYIAKVIQDQGINEYSIIYSNIGIASQITKPKDNSHIYLISSNDNRKVSLKNLDTWNFDEDTLANSFYKSFNFTCITVESNNKDNKTTEKFKFYYLMK